VDEVALVHQGARLGVLPAAPVLVAATARARAEKRRPVHRRIQDVVAGLDGPLPGDDPELSPDGNTLLFADDDDIKLVTRRCE
jgi:hypothetical protein